MPRTVASPHASISFIAGAKVAIRAVARGLEVLAAEHTLAEDAAAKSTLFRQRRTELRSLYLKSDRETGNVSDASVSAEKPGAEGERNASVTEVPPRRNR